jgi:hypothetical protein
MAKKMTATVKGSLIGAAALLVATAIGLFVTLRQTNAQAPAQQAVASASASRSVLKLPMALTSEFFPSGWMGDGEAGQKYLSVSKIGVDVDGKNKIATKIVYQRGPKGWAGIYWQHPDKNWGDQPGLDLTGARKITFIARGEKGGEVVEFLAGGIKGQHADTFKKSIGDALLTTAWQPFEIDIEGLDLRNVVGAFAWSAPIPETGELTFYVADLQIQ